MSREDPQFKLRWAVELKDKVSQSAKENNRSMNAEIVYRLEKSFESSGDQINSLIDDQSVNRKIINLNPQAKSSPVIHDFRERGRLARMAAEAVLKVLEEDCQNHKSDE